MDQSVFRLALIISSFALLLTACGGPQSSQRAPSASSALTGTAEWLEFETPQVRREIFREVARASISQAGRPASEPVLFPMLVGTEFVAAPGFDPRVDLLLGADAGGQILFVLDGSIDRWTNDRRDSFGGLSEREAAELLARSLLTLWKVQPVGAVRVERAAGAPWAAAWIDGVLHVNPAFVYLATAPTTP